MRVLDFHSQAGLARAPLILAGTVVAALVLMSLPAYERVNQTSRQTEAKVMLSYMATLQSAYHTDNGKYAIFTDFYGSEMEGRDQCTQPHGADDLGFILRSCGKNPREDGLRYAYRALGSEDVRSGKRSLPNAFVGEAVSGSDVTGESFICIGTKNEEIWHVSSKKEHSVIKSCGAL